MRSIRPVDLGLAALLAVTGVLEVALTDVADQRPVATASLALLAAGAMLLRSVQPVACLAVTVCLVVLAHLPGSGALTAALVVGFLLALASVGRHARDALSIAGVLTAATVFVVGAAFTGRPWDVVVALIGCGAAWGAGRLLRRESRRAAEMSSLAAELLEQRDVRAREAVQGERLRMARELHDTVAHLVSVMTLQVGGVRRGLDDDPDRQLEREVLLDVERLGREAVAELHRTLGVLRTPGGHGPADEAEETAPQPRLADLAQLVARVRAAGVPVELTVEGAARPLPAGLELAGYRVVQEALTNVLKHSPGATTRVRVACTDESLELTIQDDGPDQPPDAVEERTGLGLTGIRERMALYGGSLHAGPLDRGFLVRASFPLSDASSPLGIPASPPLSIP